MIIKCIPEIPLLEEFDDYYSLSLDFMITSDEKDEAELTSIVMECIRNDELVGRKIVDSNGVSPGIKSMNRTVFPGSETCCVFNPFHTIEKGLAFSHLRFVFRFSHRESTIETSVDVYPKRFSAVTELELPLKGRILTYEAHDFLSHHRRVDLSHPVLQKIKLFKNSGRYSFDFCPVTPDGRLSVNDGSMNEDWLGYGADVFAPADGVITGLENSTEDNVMGQKEFDFDQVFDNPASLFGNHVIIDHENGEYSLLAHLMKGSLKVKRGQKVERNTKIAKLGLSGCTSWCHLHYELRESAEFDCHGLPSSFSRASPASDSFRRGKRLNPQSGVVIITQSR